MTYVFRRPADYVLKQHQWHARRAVGTLGKLTADTYIEPTPPSLVESAVAAPATASTISLAPAAVPDDDDILIAILQYATSGAISGVPSGWSAWSVGEITDGTYDYSVYWKRASSESVGITLAQIVGQATYSGAGGGATTTAMAPHASTNTGDLVFLALQLNPTADNVAPVPNTPSGWTLEAGGALETTGDTKYGYLYSRVWQAGDTSVTATWTNTSTYVGTLVTVTNQGSSWENVSSSTFGQSDDALPSLPDITTTTPYTLNIGFLFTWGNVLSTAPTGYTLLTGGGGVGTGSPVVVYKDQPVAGATGELLFGGAANGQDSGGFHVAIAPTGLSYDWTLDSSVLSAGVLAVLDKAVKSGDPIEDADWTTNASTANFNAPSITVAPEGGRYDLVFFGGDTNVSQSTAPTGLTELEDQQDTSIFQALNGGVLATGGPTGTFTGFLSGAASGVGISLALSPVITSPAPARETPLPRRWHFFDRRPHAPQLYANRRRRAQTAAAILSVAEGVAVSATGSQTEAQVRAGGEPIVITISNATWDATIGADNELTELLISGLRAAEQDTLGWNQVVIGGLPYDEVINSSGDLTNYWRLHEDGTDDIGGITAVPSGTYDFRAGLLEDDSNKCFKVDGLSGRAWTADAASHANIWDSGGSASCIIRPWSEGRSGSGMFMGKVQWAFGVTGKQGGKVKLYFKQNFTLTHGQWETTDYVVALGTRAHVQVDYDSDSTSNTPTIFVNGEALTVANGGLTVVSTPTGTRSTDLTTPGIFAIGGGGVTPYYHGEVDEVALFSAEQGEAFALKCVAAASNPAGLTYLDVTRTSDTRVTVTLPAFPLYDTLADETITITVDPTLHSGSNELTFANAITITSDGATTHGYYPGSGGTAGGIGGRQGGGTAVPLDFGGNYGGLGPVYAEVAAELAELGAWNFGQEGLAIGYSGVRNTRRLEIVVADIASAQEIIETGGGSVAAIPDAPTPQTISLPPTRRIPYRTMHRVFRRPRP